MTDITMPPEHKLRPAGGRVAATAHHRTPHVTAAAPATLQPLTLWRTLPPRDINSNAVGHIELLLAQTTLLHEPRWDAARNGDAASAISIALMALPLISITARFDLAMSALCLCALEGDAAARLVIAHTLRRLPQDAARNVRLAAAWPIPQFHLPRRRQAPPLCIQRAGDIA